MKFCDRPLGDISCVIDNVIRLRMISRRIQQCTDWHLSDRKIKGAMSPILNSQKNIFETMESLK